MQIACFQFDIAWEDKAANYARVGAMGAAARLAPGALLILPEMFATGFSMNAAAIAEPLEGPTATFLAELAKQYGIFVLGGVAVSCGEGRPRNEALAFDPAGRLLTRYAKMHLFGLAGETEHYSPGDAPGRLALPECPAQVAICYDLRFPELFRSRPRPSPELYVVIANWPAHREAHWLALLRARAIENQAYVAAVNRSGADPRFTYSGRSQIIDPQGQVVAETGNGESILRAELDLGTLRAYREKFPALADAREDLMRREK